MPHDPELVAETGAWLVKAEANMRATVKFNLVASRDKPRVEEAVPEEELAKLIRAVLGIEREIQDRLDKLLREVEA